MKKGTHLVGSCVCFTVAILGMIGFAWSGNLDREQLPGIGDSRATVHVGDVAPAFRVPLTDGSLFSLYNNWGAIILITVWTST
jgi:hypothetical protein